MIDLRPVLYVVGLMTAGFGPPLLVCALVDLGSGSEDWTALLVTAIIVMGIGALLATANRGVPLNLSLRQAFLLTVLAWAMIAVVGTLPFLVFDLELSVADAVFESVSGITTTGSTVLVGLDSMSPGLLLWRSLLQWIGGIGVIAMSILILPFLRVSGMQLFRLESSDISEKGAARIVVMVRQIVVFYVGFTFLGVLLLAAGGMTIFDAVNHAMTAISTGGFSTHDASIGYFPSIYLQVVLWLLMLIGSLTFPLMVGVFAGRWRALATDPQTRFYLSMLLGIIVVLSAWRMFDTGEFDFDTIWSSAFNVTSVITTTGFATEDYTAWGSFAMMVFFVILMFGGSTGSTSGGIKAFRIHVLLKAAAVQMMTRIMPSRIVPLTYGDRVVTDDVIRSAAVFVWLMFGTVAVIALGLAATGLDFITALSGAAQAVANIGPGLGPIIGPAGNFSSLSDFVKWLLSAAMFLGRLEIVVVLVVLSPAFWRR